MPENFVALEKRWTGTIYINPRYVAEVEHKSGCTKASATTIVRMANGRKHCVLGSHCDVVAKLEFKTRGCDNGR